MKVGITLFVSPAIPQWKVAYCVIAIPDVLKKKEKRNEKRNPIQPFAEFHLKINKRLRAG